MGRGRVAREEGRKRRGSEGEWVDEGVKEGDECSEGWG